MYVKQPARLTMIDPSIRLCYTTPGRQGRPHIIFQAIKLQIMLYEDCEYQLATHGSAVAGLIKFGEKRSSSSSEAIDIPHTPSSDLSTSWCPATVMKSTKVRNPRRPMRKLYIVLVHPHPSKYTHAYTLRRKMFILG